MAAGRDADGMPLKDWVSYSEKFGTPGVLGQTTAAKGSDAGNAMREAVAAFNQNFAGVVYGADGTIKEPISVITANGQGDLPFAPLVELCDRAMTALWRGSDLSTMSADKKGASVQEDESETLLVDDARMISEALNIYVDRWVIWQKFGTDKPLANAKLVVPTKEDVTLDLAIDQFLLNAGAKLGARERMEHYGRQEMEADDTPLRTPGSAAGVAGEKPVKAGTAPDPTDLPNTQAEPSLESALDAIFDAFSEKIEPATEEDLLDAAEKEKSKTQQP